MRLQKKDVWWKEENRKVKRHIYQSKKDVNERFGRKKNQNVD